MLDQTKRPTIKDLSKRGSDELHMGEVGEAELGFQSFMDGLIGEAGKRERERTQALKRSGRNAPPARPRGRPRRRSR